MATTPLPHGGPVLLTIPQVAQRLGVSVRKVYRLISKGTVQAVRIGERGTRVLESDLDSLIAGLPGARGPSKLAPAGACQQ